MSPELEPILIAVLTSLVVLTIAAPVGRAFARRVECGAASAGARRARGPMSRR